MTSSSTRPTAERLRYRRTVVSIRLDPVLQAQARAALGPIGVSLTTLLERLMLDFLRTNRTPADVASALAGLPRQDKL